MLFNMLKVVLGLPEDVLPDIQSRTPTFCGTRISVLIHLLDNWSKNRQVDCWWTPWKRDLVSKSRCWNYCLSYWIKCHENVDVEHSMIVSSSSKGRLCHLRLWTMIIFQNGCFFFQTKKYGQMFVAPGLYLLVSDMGGPTLGAACKKLGILGKIHF